jgi:hypothetical protein
VGLDGGEGGLEGVVGVGLDGEGGGLETCMGHS